MVWPWSVSSLMNFNWIGPDHNPKDLRALENHLASGGIVYVLRSAGDFSAIVSRGSHGRTSDSGTMLNVSLHASLVPNGTLAHDINSTGTCFVGRAAIPHASAPTVRYYALTRSDLMLRPSRISAVPGAIYSSDAWLRDMLAHATFMFSQGLLTATAIQHPVFSLPIVTVICACCLQYYNLTLLDFSGDRLTWLARE